VANPSIVDRYYELFLGWRYLYRRRSGLAAPVAAVLGLTGLIAGQLALFHFSQVRLGALLTVPSAIVFCFALLANFFSIFTTVSIVGVSLGVAALTTVLSVMSGFQASFKAKVLGVNAHVLVMKYGRDFGEYRDVMRTCAANPNVIAVAPFVFEEMLLSSGRATSGALVKGIDPTAAAAVLDVGERLEKGKLTDLEESAETRDKKDQAHPMLLGRELAKKLRVKLGDRLRLIVPSSDFGLGAEPAGAGDGSSREFKVVGIFHAGFDEYDRRLAYIHIRDAQALLGTGDRVMGVEMRLHDVDAAPKTAKQLLDTLGGSPFRVIDWQDLNHNLFTAVRTQKLFLGLFLTLIVLVAAFNIVAALSMLVVDKTREVAILKSMGLPPNGAVRIFLVSGLTIGMIGIVLGLGLGLMMCVIVGRYGYALDPHVYLIDKLPVVISPVEMLITVAATIVICFLATLYPSLKAGSLQPVDGLRRD
jgi:lipoprotein-releasing system permease protein